MNALTKAIKSKLATAKDVAVDATATVLSAPKRMYHDRQSAVADQDYKKLTTARKYKGAPFMDAKGKPTDAAIARTAADEVRMRRMGKEGFKQYMKNNP